ncbi:MAG: hypothetical protein COB20_06300 [SAR86 cluster bacterium]|uniref:YdhG-like domain-containing protein n=1 Tax=SAR86 cluster bacterium TaxID=2030880 RepID=A0A2A4X874_9GAMM|nr:MAG: hypothetical protein COB20_06300 [SAR86 cluster bacterium]
MSDAKKIDAYIAKHTKWCGQLAALRAILTGTELEEAVKWGSPSYSLDNKILMSLVGFKNHCAIWFHQGVFLEDTKAVLMNAQEGTTKGMRQLRIFEGDKVNKRLVKAYVIETIVNHRAGKKIASAKKTLKISVELDAVLKKDKKLDAAFNALTPGRQREYADHIASAKQEKTRVTRMEKAAPLILLGVGLHDKTKNC